MHDFARLALRTAIAGLLLICLLQVTSIKDIAAQTPAPENGAESGLVREVPLPGGEKQRVLYASPALPRGAIVMLPGGAGDVGADGEGGVSHGSNFVVRTQALWLEQGYAVIIPDALGGQNMRGLRSSPAYAKVVAALVDFAHARDLGPVFLLGTSQGSIAAMNGAAHLPASALAGLVLTESVSRESKSGETVFDASPGQVTVPTLIVANRDSTCRVAPADDAARIAAALTRAPEVKILYVHGGASRSRPCGSLSPHGYLGIEQEVVTKIGGWLKTHQ